MKRFTLVLAVFLGFTVAMNAQTYVGSFDTREIIGIPGCFTNSGHSYISFCNFNEEAVYVYDNDLTTCLANIVSSEILEGYYYGLSNYIDLSTGFYDFSNVNGFGNKVVFTQNLFNSDDNFEYLWKGDDGLEIKTIVGNTLQTIQTINADEGYQWVGSPTIARIDDIYYLMLGAGPSWDVLREIVFYRIDQSQGLTKIDMQLPISVFPTMPTREQQITVELSEKNNASEITVVNSLGQVVKRVPVEEGQRTVTIPANELGSGLNVVNTRNGKGQGSCKIIVR